MALQPLNTNEDYDRLAIKMKERASNQTPFTQEEVDTVLKSLENVDPATECDSSSINVENCIELLKKVAHLSHKDWKRTGENAERLHQILLGEKGIDSNDALQSMLDRVLREGNWEGAFNHTSSTTSSASNNKPWVVLVTGLNGIRKTTSIYQDWFPNLLSEALVPPPNGMASSDIPLSQLPCGGNSFFRQLDHMITILVNEEFQRLYHVTDVETYARLKDGIFTRYRTLAELLGVVLVREAQRLKLNIMAETSGKDVAMFDYIDTFFKDEEYNKLVLHFTINDINYAEQSVDSRMAKEIVDGQAAMNSKNVQNIINANAGGPYGSKALKGVLSDSDRVWNQIVNGEVKAGQTWYKASIQIDASNPPKAWTAAAVKSDGSKSDTTYSFPVR